jgi:abortive infection bacteriophage resistance protein
MTRPPKIPFVKLPKTFVEQIEKLKSRGLSVPEPAKAELYLSQLNYYRFAAYCLPFERRSGAREFRTGTSFDDVLNLYIFDRELRLLLLDAIERIEVSLRTQMAYHLSHRHDTAHPHLQPALFYNMSNYQASIRKLIDEVGNSREEFILHLKNKYQEPLPPIWAVVELMTMGQLSRWFGNISQRADRQAIAKNYKIDERILKSFCQHLTTVRNHCAHHARLWNRDFTFIMRIPNRGERVVIDSFYKNGRSVRKLYNSLVLIAYLMDTISPGHCWKRRLVCLISTHGIETCKMGFPSDWQSKPIWLE